VPISAATWSPGGGAGVVTAEAGPARPGLAGLGDLELLGILRSLPLGSERRSLACELLVSRHRLLVRSCVRRYQRSPEPAEDLIQVGYVGLMKAINNFDPAFGGSLAAYAQPCIIGEIKRHFRDKRWLVHVKRSVQELILEAREATVQLTQDLGRAPSEADLARHLGVSGVDLREAQRAELAFRPSSLDAPMAGQPGMASLGDLLGGEDPGIEHMLGIQSVVAHWDELPDREQQILVLRFYGDMTQTQIATRLGISQMHVSRLLAHALGYLRPRLLGLPEHPAAQIPPLPRPLARHAAARPSAGVLSGSGRG
jgi:RNA polymerase sigma-B factor